jgi:hypothetical protein
MAITVADMENPKQESCVYQKVVMIVRRYFNKRSAFVQAFIGMWDVIINENHRAFRHGLK